MRPGLKILQDRTRQLAEGMALLAGTRVLVGVPESMADSRPDPEAYGEQPLNNAELAYLHDNGAPEAHIPARPFMVPGIKNNQPRIDQRFKRAALSALDGDRHTAEKQFIAAGQETADSIKAVITSGIPPPLAESTLRGRIAKHPQGRLGDRRELLRRGMGKLPSLDLAKPLIDSGNLLHAISFALKKAGQQGSD